MNQKFLKFCVQQKLKKKLKLTKRRQINKLMNKWTSNWLQVAKLSIKLTNQCFSDSLNRDCSCVTQLIMI